VLNKCFFIDFVILSKHKEIIEVGLTQTLAGNSL
jgi:hypothetical protein